ncbi:MAG: metallophosphatase domain-containing protein [Vicinamibacteria bacterium]|nr:metallophosphatase domain-containing protein [Vicinamibacteria bacterium]
MRLVLISDTHNQQSSLVLPAGDALVHAGDFTMRGAEVEVAAFGAWLEAQPFRHKIVVAGNHDFLFEREPRFARSLLPGAAHYLFDSEVTLEGLRFWGAPWQPWFLDWAFNLQRGEEIAAKWALIPEGVDVLITHGPPMGTADRTARGENVGCADLGEAMARVKPRLSVFGHIHEGYGVHGDKVNAAICDEKYRPVNRPIVVDLARGGGAPVFVPESSW